MHKAGVHIADPSSPAGVEVTRDEFFAACDRSARSRFPQPSGAAHVVEHPVVPRDGSALSTGTIIAYVGPRLWRAWHAQAPGNGPEKALHVTAQLHLALDDLADQNMHGYLAATPQQCATLKDDLEQLTTEALSRTTFCRLGQLAQPSWEGTLVERIRPPFLDLVMSVELAASRGRSPTRCRPARVSLSTGDGRRRATGGRRRGRTTHPAGGPAARRSRPAT